MTPDATLCSIAPYAAKKGRREKVGGFNEIPSPRISNPVYTALKQ